MPLFRLSISVFIRPLLFHDFCGMVKNKAHFSYERFLHVSAEQEASFFLILAGTKRSLLRVRRILLNSFRIVLNSSSAFPKVPHTGASVEGAILWIRLSPCIAPHKGRALSTFTFNSLESFLRFLPFRECCERNSGCTHCTGEGSIYLKSNHSFILLVPSLLVSPVSALAVYGSFGQKYHRRIQKIAPDYAIWGRFRRSRY